MLNFNIKIYIINQSSILLNLLKQGLYYLSLLFNLSIKFQNIHSLSVTYALIQCWQGKSLIDIHLKGKQNTFKQTMRYPEYRFFSYRKSLANGISLENGSGMKRLWINNDTHASEIKCSG